MIRWRRAYLCTGSFCLTTNALLCARPISAPHMYIICVSFPLGLLLLFSSYVSVHTIARHKHQKPPPHPNRSYPIPTDVFSVKHFYSNPDYSSYLHTCNHVCFCVGSFQAIHVRLIENCNLAAGMSMCWYWRHVRNAPGLP